MKGLIILATVVVLSGCAAQRPTAADDPSLRCFQNLDSDARFQALVPRLARVSTPATATIEMRASREHPTEEEKKVLSMWGVSRQVCWDMGRAYRAAYAPPGYADAYDEAQSSILQAIASLYSGNINYGEFIAVRERIGLTANARTGEAARRDVAARAQQARDNQDRINAALQTLIQAQPKPMPPTFSPSVNCTSRAVGNTVQTNCF